MTDSVTISQRRVDRVVLRTGALPQMVVGASRTRVVISYRGVPGRDGGGAGAATTIPRIAGEAVGGHRAIAVDAAGVAFYANPAVAALRVPAGVSSGAASIGAAVLIQPDGVMDEPSWTWGAGPIFLGASGMLTQSAPTSGAVVIVGHATGPTSMRVDPQLVALLS